MPRGGSEELAIVWISYPREEAVPLGTCKGGIKVMMPNK